MKITRFKLFLPAKQFIRTKIEQLPQNSKRLVRFCPFDRKPPSTFIYLYSADMLNIYFIRVKMLVWFCYRNLFGAMSRDIFSLWKMQMGDKWNQGKPVAWCSKCTIYYLYRTMRFMWSNGVAEVANIDKMQLQSAFKIYSRNTFRDSFIYSLQWRSTVPFFSNPTIELFYLHLMPLSFFFCFCHFGFDLWTFVAFIAFHIVFAPSPSLSKSAI